MVNAWVLALNTFREATRDRVTHALLAAGVFLIFAAFGIAQLSLDQQVRVLIDVGIAALSLMTLVGALVLSAPLIHREVERRTLYMMLTRPLARTSFTAGKYAGVLLTLAVTCALLGTLLLWLLVVQVGKASLSLALVMALTLAAGIATGWLQRKYTASVLVFGVAALLAALALAAQATPLWLPVALLVLLAALEGALLAGLTLGLASFSTPMLSALMATGIWIAGRSADLMATTQSKVLPDAIKSALRVTARVVPNFQLYAPKRHVIESMVLSPAGVQPYLLQVGLYTVAYAGGLVLLAALIFRRRNLA